MKTKEIAQIINAQIQGNDNLEIKNIATLPKEAKEAELAFVFPERLTKAKKYLQENKAKVLVIAAALNEDEKFQDFIKDQDITILVVKRPKFALSLLLPSFQKACYKPDGVHPSAVIDESVKLAEGVVVGAFCYLGPNVSIGKNTILYPRVTITANASLGEDCKIRSGVVIEDYSEIGDRVMIHANTVVGSDGYSYATQDATNLEKMQKGDFSFNMDRQVQHKVNSAGKVIIEDDVEIGANVCIDKATLATTKIGLGSKIDNLCQIAHNVQIDKDCLIIAQAGIAGSSKIGDRVTIAGKTGCGDGVTIGNDVVVAAFSAVNSDLDPFLPVIGIPAIPYGEYMKRQRVLVRLPKFAEEVRKLKSTVKDLSRDS